MKFRLGAERHHSGELRLAADAKFVDHKDY